MSYSDAVRSARAQVLIDSLDGAATPGVFEFYSDSRPVTKGDAITSQVLLATLVLSQTSATVLDGVTTFNSVNDDLSIDASGTIGWVRGKNGDGDFVFDAEVGLAGSGEPFILTGLVAVLSGSLKLISGVITGNEGNI